MIVDSSALIAIVFGEPEATRLASAIAGAHLPSMSTVNWLEAMMVIESRYGRESADDALLILQQLGVQPAAFDMTQMHEAREAWRRYGKGRHPASLNMGDCCAYAAALVHGEPLLFKGDDFALTDIQKADW